MTLYYIITFFLFGTILGSFYNVVASRLPKGESIAFPSSHCDNCKHILTPLELIPIFSFLLLRGKCKTCGVKISAIHPFFEFMTGLLFSLSYLSFGLSLELVIALTFVSIIIIVIISDYHYMIISDEVLIVGSILLLIEIFFIRGFSATYLALFNGIIAFLIMYGLKKLGDFLFKKESMGGGDIKLLFVFGLVLTFPIAIISIFIGSLIGLPVSLLILKIKKTNIIPFGPFLGIGALILFLYHINFEEILNLFII